MDLKSVLKVLGTLLLLLGIFGYLFPDWGSVQFTNNENLAHIILALLAYFFAGFSNPVRQKALLLFAIIFLVWGIYGFALPNPDDFRIGVVRAQMDEFDNWLHIAFGLVFAWFWLSKGALPSLPSLSAFPKRAKQV